MAVVKKQVVLYKWKRSEHKMRQQNETYTLKNERASWEQRGREIKKEQSEAGKKKVTLEKKGGEIREIKRKKRDQQRDDKVR